MNERIEDLMYRAGLTAQGCWDEMDAYDKQAIEKFAELIVRECMEVVIDGQYSATECEGNSHRISYNNGRYGASSDIKIHFGVEE